MIDRDLIAISVLKIALIFFLVEEKIVFGRVVGPDIFDGFVDFAFVLYLLQVLEHFERRSRPHGVVDQLFFRGQGASSSFDASSSVQYIV